MRSFRSPIMTAVGARRYFLVQSSGRRAWHKTEHFEDRTHAEELQVHHYYRHDTWHEKKRDQDFSNVKPSDVVIQYCTMDVADGPGRIRDVWEVTAVESVPNEEVEEAAKEGRVDREWAKELSENPHLLRLRLLERLDGGVPLSTIREAVDQRKVSSAMNNCGKLGFNIGEIPESDYKGLLELERAKGTELSLYEEHIQSYLAASGSAGAIDSELSEYRLFEDEDGNTGDRYDTGPVGVIDLLYVDDEGNFLVVELKRTDVTSDKVVGQLARYKGWVRHNLANGKRVRGAIVTHSHSTKLRYAIGEIQDSSLYDYEVEFAFEKVPSP